MSPEEIKSKIIILKKKQIDIAKKANVTPAAISMIIYGRGKSRRLQKIIAKEIGMPFREVWAA